MGFLKPLLTTSNMELLKDVTPAYKEIFENLQAEYPRELHRDVSTIFLF